MRFTAATAAAAISPSPNRQHAAATMRINQFGRSMGSGNEEGMGQRQVDSSQLLHETSMD
ncbi:hypothetical protein [Geomobilimonas luticola]|uniref:Uncharacterized protein n=1 Tax=Geomobilimonas luticola TaxID=1114878 RepID=A0ABS5SFS5_9BACT|nr:hypothetical protein [Geomobilimonas luticola]MBT0652872.1 hypothetical protein [Geomobilimonas luticola]